MPTLRNKPGDRIEIGTGSGKSINLNPEGTNSGRRKPIQVISEGLIRKKPGKTGKK